MAVVVVVGGCSKESTQSESSFISHMCPSPVHSLGPGLFSFGVVIVFYFIFSLTPLLVLALLLLLLFFCFSSLSLPPSSAHYHLSSPSTPSITLSLSPSLWLPFRSAETPTKYQISKPTLCSVPPGELLRLSCPLPEAAAISWTKDGSALGLDNRTLIQQELLQIRDAVPTDSGLYACSALGVQGGQTLCFIVNVTGEWARRGQGGPRQRRVADGREGPSRACVVFLKRA